MLVVPGDVNRVPGLLDEHTTNAIRVDVDLSFSWTIGRHHIPSGSF